VVLPSIKHEILEELERLREEDQHRVLAVVRTLGRKIPKGTRGRVLLRFAGVISDGYAEQMNAAIEEGCERVDVDEWQIHPRHHRRGCIAPRWSGHIRATAQQDDRTLVSRGGHFEEVDELTLASW
jgi:hypothetical protein